MIILIILPSLSLNACTFTTLRSYKAQVRIGELSGIGLNLRAIRNRAELVSLLFHLFASRHFLSNLLTKIFLLNSYNNVSIDFLSSYCTPFLLPFNQFGHDNSQKPFQKGPSNA